MAVTTLAALKATVDAGTVAQQTVSVGQVVGIKIGDKHMFGRVRTNGRNNALGTCMAVVEVITNNIGIDLGDPSEWLFVATSENRKSTNKKTGVVTEKTVIDRIRFSFPTFRLVVLASPAASATVVKATDELAKYLK